MVKILLDVVDGRVHHEGLPSLFELGRHSRIERYKLWTFASLVDKFGAGESLDRPPIALGPHIHDSSALNTHPSTAAALRDLGRREGVTRATAR